MYAYLLYLYNHRPQRVFFLNLLFLDNYALVYCLQFSFTQVLRYLTLYRI